MATFLKDAATNAANGSLPRRSLLASIAAAFSCAAAPKLPPATTEPLGVVSELLTPPTIPAEETVHAATIAWRNAGDDTKPYAIHADEAMARGSNDWKLRDSTSPHCFRIGGIDFRFANRGRCYIALQCSIDLPKPDDSDSDGCWFTPRHLLDFPRVNSDFGGSAEWGRRWEGIEAGSYYMEPGELVTREEAMAQVAAANNEILEHGRWDSVGDDSDWWVVLQIGSPIQPPSYEIDLSNGIGTLHFYSFKLGCRIVLPTEDEIARFGTIGAGKAVTHA